MSAAAVLGTLVIAWAITYAAGGSKSPAPHLLYVPIVLAATRFGTRGALSAALAAGLAVGPLMPLDVEAGTGQDAAAWITRLVMFILLGQLIATLRARSLRGVEAKLAEQRARARIEGAVSRGEFVPFFQPVVDVASGDVVGVEALARWSHPEHGVLDPDAFIPVAEATGAISLVGASILSQACRHVARWRAGVLRGRGRFELAVNLSARQLEDPEICSTIADALATSGLQPSWLVLEITETALVEDVEAAVACMEALTGLGVRLAIDDFGVGHSSLAALHRFPVEVLKIDRSLTATLTDGDRGGVLMGGIVALARSMGLTSVVAEGVETEDDLRAIASFGCDRAQGFYFSPPLDAPALEVLLAEDRRLVRWSDLTSSPR